MPALTIRRGRRWADKLRRYEIYLDARQIGLLAEGAALHHEITPGPHRLQARIDWCGSEELHFEANGDMVFWVKNELTLWQMLLHSAFNPGRYLTIDLSNPASEADEHRR